MSGCTVLSWFSSYLSCRSQQILERHSLSVGIPLVCGVPRGSVLCPLLFSLSPDSWRNSFKSSASSTTFFADDSELYSCLPTERESALRAIGNIESCCHEIKTWITKNKLKPNEQKTEVLLCGPPSRRESVPVDSLQAGEASSPLSSVVKTLGVTLDAALSSDQHVSAVVRSCFFHVRSLSKVRSYLTRKAANSISVSLSL